jgi:hypothetical protein
MRQIEWWFAAALIAAMGLLCLFVTMAPAAECASSARDVLKDHPHATYYHHDGKRCWVAGKPHHAKAARKHHERIDKDEPPAPTPVVAPVIRRASAGPWIMEGRWSGVTDTPAVAMERQTGVYIEEWFDAAQGRTW